MVLFLYAFKVKKSKKVLFYASILQPSNPSSFLVISQHGLLTTQGHSNGHILQKTFYKTLHMQRDTGDDHNT